MDIKRFLKPEKKRIITTIVLAVLVSLILILSLGEIPYLVVQSNAMSPTINKGDLIFVKSIEFEDMQVGDIALFFQETKE